MSAARRTQFGALIAADTRAPESVPVHPRDPANDRAETLAESSVYRYFLAEREEIWCHKWIESEKSGHDIGFERALFDWIRHHREGWRTARRSNPIKATPASTDRPTDAADVAG